MKSVEKEMLGGENELAYTRFEFRAMNNFLWPAIKPRTTKYGKNVSEKLYRFIREHYSTHLNTPQLLCTAEE